jgi:hypothetical protein
MAEVAPVVERKNAVSRWGAIVSGLRSWVLGAAVGVLGAGGVAAQDKAPPDPAKLKIVNPLAKKAPPKGVLATVEKKKLDPLTYREFEVQLGNLSHDRFQDREKALREIKMRMNPEVYAWLLPHTKAADLETVRRVGKLHDEHWEEVAEAKCALPEHYGFHWLWLERDGERQKFRIPSTEDPGKSLSYWEVQQHYLARANAMGCDGGPASDWENYRVALVAMLLDQRDSVRKHGLWTEADAKKYVAWLQENPEGDRGKYLTAHLDRVLRSTSDWLRVVGDLCVDESDLWRTKNGHKSKFQRGPMLNVDLRNPQSFLLDDRNMILPFPGTGDVRRASSDCMEWRARKSNRPLIRAG